MTDSAALARQLAELDKRSAFDNPAGEAAVDRARDAVSATCVSNLPAILRALCVMAAVEEDLNALPNSWARDRAQHIRERADELLADLGVAK